MRSSQKLDVAVSVEAGAWPAPAELRRLARKALDACVVAIDLKLTPDAEVSRLTDDAHIRALNARYRGKDSATNVLSFPTPSVGGVAGPLLGDIVLASETVVKEAADGLTLSAHLSHLLVHGFLHLVGYDHEDDAEAAVMEALETAILARLGNRRPLRLICEVDYEGVIPMSDTDSKNPSATASPTAADGSEAGERPRSGESWLGRIRSKVGLKSSGSLRNDLAAALASNDVTTAFSPEERSMLGNILRLREMRVDDIMVPRADIDAVNIDIALADLLIVFRKSGHSRMPVYRETLDDPIGLVHIKDLMDTMTEAGRVAAETPEGGDGAERLALDRVDLTRKLADAKLVRNILFVPPSMRVAVLLANMQASRMQMALVIDEYGGTDGLVSMEDAVEVIVGDIEDEYDEEEGAMVMPDGKGGFLADGRASVGELAAAIGTDLAASEEGEAVDTVGGLVFSLVKRIPVRGELVSAPGGYEFEVLDADPRRVKRVRITKRPANEARRRPPRATPEPSSTA